MKKFLILSGGYATEGLRNGDVAQVITKTESGYYLTGLLGTEAFADFPSGLYFANYELRPFEGVEEMQEPFDAEGKYFRDECGWIRGPMRKTPRYGDYYWSDNTGVKFNLYTLANYSSSWESLIPEPIELGGYSEVMGPPVGACVQYNGTLWFVTNVDHYDVCISNGVDSSWISRSYPLKHYPDLSLKGAEDFFRFKDMWVKGKNSEAYYKVRNVETVFENPSKAFSCYFSAVKAGDTFSTAIPVDNFDLSEAYITHPLEHTIVRGVQGTGEFLYVTDTEGNSYPAVSAGYPAVSAGYSGYYILFNLNDGNYWSEKFSHDSPVWWKYQMFRSDNPPFELPFSYAACAETIQQLHDSGYNELVSWLERHAPAAKVKAILSRAKMATNTRGNIALYLNESQIKTQKIQSLRPGRALRVLMPSITDAELEKLVDKFRKDFPVGDYVVHRSFEAWAFKKAYSGPIAPMQNPYTTSSRKSLANSCMRHDFSHLPHHPAEAYASGEFEMLWTETPEGKIGSRLVVWHPKEGKPQSGPVYGTCEYSMDLLVNAIPEAESYNQSSWVGAKLQRLDYKGHVILPYIDNEQGITVEDDHLVINNEDPDDADCAATSTGGYVSWSEGGRCTCNDCGARMSEYETYSSPNGDVCESCYSDNYFHCEEYDDTYHVDEMCTVLYMSRWGRSSRNVCTDARDNYYSLCEDGEYWHTDDVLFLADGRCLGGDAHDEAAECMMTNEYYLLDELIPTVEGDFVSKEYYNNHKEEFTMNDQGELEEVKEAA